MRYTILDQLLGDGVGSGNDRLAFVAFMKNDGRSFGQGPNEFGNRDIELYAGYRHPKRRRRIRTSAPFQRRQPPGSAMFHHHTFRLACGTRCIRNVNEVRWRNRRFNSGGALFIERLLFQVDIKHLTGNGREPGRQSGSEVMTMGASDSRLRPFPPGRPVVKRQAEDRLLPLLKSPILRRANQWNAQDGQQQPGPGPAPIRIKRRAS